jgi:small subunit ribosomal protein S20
MPNIASAKKRAKQAIVRTERNTARKSAVKTALKKVLVALDQKDIESAKKLLRDAESQVARAKGKGVIHHNTAARTIGRLATRVAAAARD